MRQGNPQQNLSESKEKEYQELLSLERRLLANEYEVKYAQRRERADAAGNTIDLFDSLSAFTLASIRGQRILLESYEHLSEDIKPKDKDKLSELVNSMISIEEFTARSLFPGENANMDKEYADKLKNSTKDTQIFFAPNTDYHYYVVKYSKENGEYYRTEYNAGVGADTIMVHKDYLIPYEVAPHYAGERKASPVETRSKVKFATKEDLEQAISYDMKEKPPEAMHLPSYINTEKLPSSKEEQLVLQQKVSNCSTRSGREMLRYEMPNSHLREMYHMIQNLSYDDILGAVQAKRKALAKDIGKSAEGVKLAQGTDLKSQIEANIINCLALPPTTKIPKEKIDSLHSKLSPKIKGDNEISKYELMINIKLLVSKGHIKLNEAGEIDISQVPQDLPSKLLDFNNMFLEGLTQESKSIMLQNQAETIAEKIHNNIPLAYMLRFEMQKCENINQSKKSSIPILKNILSEISEGSKLELTEKSIKTYSDVIKYYFNIHKHEMLKAESLFKYLKDNEKDFTNQCKEFYEQQEQKAYSKPISMQEFFAQNPKMKKIFDELLFEAIGEKDILSTSVDSVKKYVSQTISSMKGKEIPVDDDTIAQYKSDYRAQMFKTIFDDESLANGIRAGAVKTLLSYYVEMLQENNETKIGKIEGELSWEQAQIMVGDEFMGIYELDHSSIQYFANIKDTDLMKEICSKYMEKNPEGGISVSEFVEREKDLNVKVANDMQAQEVQAQKQGQEVQAQKQAQEVKAQKQAQEVKAQKQAQEVKAQKQGQEAEAQKHAEAQEIEKRESKISHIIEQGPNRGFITQDNRERKSKIVKEIIKRKKKSPSHEYTEGKDAEKEREQGRYKPGGHLPLER